MASGPVPHDPWTSSARCLTRTVGGKRFTMRTPAAILVAAIVVAATLAGGARAAPAQEAPVRATPAEWPLPVPHWFWDWARWYLHRGELASQPFRSETTRPTSAPREIPPWGWRRLGGLSGRTPLERAAHLARDRVQRLDEAMRVRVHTRRRSTRDPSWSLVAGSVEVRGSNESRPVATWLQLQRGRWVVYYLGLERHALRPVPATPVPCDIRSASGAPGCEPRISAQVPTAAVRSFITAASAGDEDAMWTLLSPAARERLGPTKAAFANGTASAIEEGWGSWAAADYSIGEHRVGPFAVVTVSGVRTVEGTREHGATAAALDRIGGLWRLELAGPVEVTFLIPSEPGVRTLRPRIGAEFSSSRRPLRTARVWIDGTQLPLEVIGGDTRDLSVSGRPKQALSPGDRVVTSFAASSLNAVATARVLHVSAG
jgi:hypothetical protein